MSSDKPLADDFYRIAHHDITGRRHLSSRAVGLGLSAALLGELLLSHNIEVGGEHLMVISRQPPADALAHTLLDQIVAEPQLHAVPTWLQYFAAEATELVAKRMERAGHLRAEGIGLIRKHFIYVPVDPNTAASPTAALSIRLHRCSPVEPHLARLAGLCFAASLHPRLLDGAPPQSGEYLQHIVDNLWAPMRDLLHHTSATLAGTILAPGT